MKYTIRIGRETNFAAKKNEDKDSGTRWLSGTGRVSERKLLSATKSVRHILAAVILLIMVIAFMIPAVPVMADATDEIRDFTITVDVNEDASLNMNYHIEWEVLDDSIGELEWIDIGVPNSFHEDVEPISDTIDHIDDNGSSLAIYLDRGYGEDEIVSVDFSMKQDHMYQIDKWVEGESVYTFTPAWFDGMDVDRLTIRWNAENAGAWQPDCLQEDGYLVFETSLAAGEKYTISVVYPNDVFGFVPERQAGGSGGDYKDSYDGSYKSGNGGYSIAEGIGILIGIVIFLGFIAAPFIALYKFIRWIAGGTGFGSGISGQQQTKKKITRTKIEYYESCPGCGAVREDGKDKCAYCGRSMIKSKEVLEEDQIEEPEKYKIGRAHV